MSLVIKSGSQLSKTCETRGVKAILGEVDPIRLRRFGSWDGNAPTMTRLDA